MKTLRKVFLIAIAAMFVATQAQAVLFFARSYDPNLARWITRDPMGERGGNNLYAYVDNNPVNKVDPLGFEGNPISGLGGAWNSNPDGAGGSFYGPGLYYTPPSIPDSGLGNTLNNAAQSANDFLTDQSMWDFFAMDTDGASKLGEPLAAGLGAGIIKFSTKCVNKTFSAEKAALVDMAQLDKRLGVTKADMQAYIDLNKGLPDPFPVGKVRLDLGHLGANPVAQGPHGHVGSVDYIPVK